MKNILQMIAVALITGAVLGLIVVGLVGKQSAPSKDLGYTGTRFPNGLSADGFTQGGGVLTFTATSTQSARTLTESEMINNNVIEIAAVASPALALTLPATSTMTTLLPKAGDFRTWVIDNQQAAATTTTVTAGTGIDLIAYTTNDDVIDGQEVSILTCWRKANTDVYCHTSELLKAD